MTIDPAVIAQSVQPVLSGCSDVIAAYLFGSAVSGTVRPDSDIDIAVLLSEPGSRSERKETLQSLFSPLCRALRADVHLLFLNDASYLARAQVFSKGKLFYIRDHEQLALFRMKSLSLFTDFAPTMEMTRKGLQKKMRRS